MHVLRAPANGPWVPLNNDGNNAPVVNIVGLMRRSTDHADDSGGRPSHAELLTLRLALAFHSLWRAFLHGEHSRPDPARRGASLNLVAARGTRYPFAFPLA